MKFLWKNKCLTYSRNREPQFPVFCTQVAGRRQVRPSGCACLTLTQACCCRSRSLILHTHTHMHTHCFTPSLMSHPTPDDQLFGRLLSASLWSEITARLQTLAWLTDHTPGYTRVRAHGLSHTSLLLLVQSQSTADDGNKRKNTSTFGCFFDFEIYVALLFIISHFLSMTAKNFMLTYFY